MNDRPHPPVRSVFRDLTACAWAAVRLAPLSLGLLALPAGAAQKGDIDLDCDVDLADALLLQRALDGEITLGSQAEKNADVAPWDDTASPPGPAPDSNVDLGDLVVLHRAVVEGWDLPSDRPVLTPLVGDPQANTANPISIDIDVPVPNGVEANVTFSVNDRVQPDTVVVTGDASGSGTGTLDILALFDGDNEITATSTIGAATSCPAEPAVVNYENQQSRSISGSLAQPLVLTPGDPGNPNDIDGPYTVTSDYTIDATDTNNGILILQPGVELRFASGTQLLLNDATSELRIQGEPETMVVLTSADLATPSRGDWAGIDLRKSASTIDYALIEYATIGVRASNPTGGPHATVTNSIIREFSSRGIHADQARPLMASNTIDNYDNGSGAQQGAGIRLNGTGGVTIADNKIRGATTGIDIDWANATISGNTIEFNGRGISFIRPTSSRIKNGNRIRNNTIGIDVGCLATDGYAGCVVPLESQPVPSAINNEIHGNDTNLRFTYQNYGLTSIPNLARNWWGASDLPSVEATLNILDPNVTLDYLPFYVDQARTTLDTRLALRTVSADTPDPNTGYEAIGDLFVDIDETWEIPAGASIALPPGLGIDVHGTLLVAGTDQNPAIFDTLAAAACEDGVDNDGDGDTDYPEDADCQSPDDVTEDPPLTDRQCHDGIDNEGDGTVDHPDSQPWQQLDPQPPLDPECAEVRTLREAPTWTDYWRGIQIHPDSTGTVVDYALVDHAVVGLAVNSAPDVVLSNSTMLRSRDSGVLFENAAGGQVDANLIDSGNVDTERSGTGIHVLDSAPGITGNTIQNLQVGIHVHGTSNPAIDGENTITGNQWGLWIQGPGLDSPAQNPRPVINGNNIHGNTGPFEFPDEVRFPTTDFYRDYEDGPAPRCQNTPANVCLSDFATADPVSSIDATGNWWGTTVLAEIRDGIVSHPDSTVSLDIADYLDGPGGIAVPGSNPAFSSLVSNVAVDKRSFRPGEGEDVQISFFSALNGTGELRIYEEDLVDDNGNPLLAPVLVRTIEMPTVLAGSNSILWDGRDESSQLVPDEAYAYVIEVTASGVTDSYDPAINETHFGAGVFLDPPIDIAYNTFTNDNWRWEYRLKPHTLTKSLSDAPDEGFPSRVSLQVGPDPSGPPSVPTFYPAFRIPLFNDQPRWFIFDGRLPDGSFLEDEARFYFAVPEPMRRNFVMVEGTVPELLGPVEGLTVQDAPDVPPSVTVRSNPYLVRHSYEQITTLAYTLDTDAKITVTVFDETGEEVAAPLYYNELTGAFEPIVDVLQAGDPETPAVHVVEWWGSVGATPPESNELDTGVAGVHTFTIRAENPNDSNLYTVYRGVIQVRE